MLLLVTILNPNHSVHLIVDFGFDAFMFFRLFVYRFSNVFVALSVLCCFEAFVFESL